MVKKSIFREYDIRGIVGSELNKESVKLIGYFFGKKVFDKFKENSYIAIGYDARTHSPELFSYLASGLNAAGCKVLNMQMVATGINYFANYQTFEIENKKITPCASIMITGSHNPSEYNGFKITFDKKPFFAEEIYSLGDEIIASNIEIEDNDKAFEIDVKSLYIDFMLKEFSALKAMKEKIIIDCGNGVADTVLTQILDKLELNYEGLYCKPDGTFPNHHPDPSEEKNLKDIKEKLKGDFEYGFAYDGDADRIAFLTKKHNVKGDIMALLFSKNIENPVVVGEVKCTQVMYDLINERGSAHMYKTGHSNLKVKLKEVNAHLAAEVSGHIFFNDRYYGFDDAIYATFRVLELIKNGMDIDKEVEALPKTFSTEEIKVETTEEEKFLLIDKLKELLKNPPKEFPKIRDIIDVDGVRVIFDKGWGLVRASNTTPVLVTRFESTDENEAKEYEKQLNNLIREAKNELSSTAN
ncbi:phosphomannomutase/phosphoglucomutase [Halarcobacter bivalviorum]|uniref:Phospho-sugar mutase n=1 Tax=Halarcobacter bivalviorum TaxID=663364 RepID=A0AAX2A7V0_9BACT|nr:phosphomannomutase/phosphoglucomutase [Halarcobacter bivalviorum]AXH11133.1 phosphomannomutase / phosphoglucomutase [Halarcobacter bivalviorum]RXK09682.1 phospho-sugar mutase [Halarcobacter bivalviorum]